LSLNGVARAGGTLGSNAISCPTSASCTVNMAVGDATGYAIAYSGSAVVPTQGQAPTSGNVFDNNGGGSVNLTFASSNSSVGTVTGGAHSSGSNTYSTYASGTVTVVGVSPDGGYTVSVACVAGASGSFAVVAGGTGAGSGDVTSSELSGLTPAVAYPTLLANSGTNPFTCNNGAISGPAGAASGTIVTN
jgi:hypothetical protein